MNATFWSLKARSVQQITLRGCERPLGRVSIVRELAIMRAGLLWCLSQEGCTSGAGLAGPFSLSCSFLITGPFVTKTGHIREGWASVGAKRQGTRDYLIPIKIGALTDCQ